MEKVTYFGASGDGTMEVSFAFGTISEAANDNYPGGLSFGYDSDVKAGAIFREGKLVSSRVLDVKVADVENGKNVIVAYVDEDGTIKSNEFTAVSPEALETIKDGAKYFEGNYIKIDADNKISVDYDAVLSQIKNDIDSSILRSDLDKVLADADVLNDRVENLDSSVSEKFESVNTVINDITERVNNFDSSVADKFDNVNAVITDVTSELTGKIEDLDSSVSNKFEEVQDSVSDLTGKIEDIDSSVIGKFTEVQNAVDELNETLSELQVKKPQNEWISVSDILANADAENE